MQRLMLSDFANHYKHSYTMLLIPLPVPSLMVPGFSNV